MGTYNGANARDISYNLDLYESARSGFFTFIVDDLDNIVRSTYTGDRDNIPETGVIVDAQKKLELNVVQCDFAPGFSLEVLKYTRGNEVVKFAGVPTWKDGSIKVDDVIGLETKEILMAWRALAYDVNTGKGGRMKDYKKNCTVIEYTQDFEKVRTWTLYGCWISDISEDGFDRENDGKRQITAKIEYDRAIEVLPNEEKQ